MRRGAMGCGLAAWLVASVPVMAEQGRWVGRWMQEEPVADLVDAGPDESAVADEGIEPDEPAERDPGFAAVFAVAPEGFLIDPERLLSPGATRDRAEFLRGHAEESTIGLYVYVFGGSAVLPEDVGLDHDFAGGSVAVVLFFPGDPQRAGFFLGAPLARAISEIEQRRALQSSIMQAAEMADPEDQLDAFLEQMSIRLYWMEQMLDEAKPGVPTVPVVPVADAAAPPPTFEWPAHWRPWLITAAVLVVVVPVVGWVYRCRARYRLPVLDVEPRLGGGHAAGVGGVISFVSAEVPPAAQRDQTARDSPQV